MTPKLRHVVGIALLSLSSMGAYTCRFGPTPPQGAFGLAVPYHYQQFDAIASQPNRNYCVPASILMVKDFYNGGFTPDSVQHTIWNDAVGRGWAALGLPPFGGFSVAHIGAAFTLYSGYPYTNRAYADRRQALADAEKNIAQGHPVPAIAHGGSHIVVIKGVAWTADASTSSRPRQAGVYIHDPDVPPAVTVENIVDIPNWLGFKGSGCSGTCAINISRFDTGIAADDYAEFEAAAGTYLGETAPPVLSPHERLYPGQNIRSRNGQYMLTYQGDGNLVLYGPSGAIWHTATWGAPGYAMMQGDGNLVVRDNVATPLWWSGTSTPNAYLSVHDSGHLAVSTEPFSEVWSAGPPPTPPGGGGGGGGGSNPGSVPSGGRLYAGESSWSPSGAYFLTLQGDGNLVLYTAGGTPLWASGTAGTSPGRLDMQGDGNLVLYDSGGTPLWATMTNFNPGAHLYVQDDSNLVVYGAAGDPLWAR